MLILFDIDGTLVTSHHVGLRSMAEAGRELFGPHFTLDNVEVAGRLDPLIFADACRIHGIRHDHNGVHETFRAKYADVLRRNIDAERPVRILPGIRELIDRLVADATGTLALLTGNYPETGHMKIAAAGIEPSTFAFGAYGIDGPTRNDLPPVAFGHYKHLHRREVDPRCVTIIGDTPHDIACARAHGCRVIAVATGIHAVADLAPHEPDLLVENLSETQTILTWLSKVSY